MDYRTICVFITVSVGVSAAVFAPDIATDSGIIRGKFETIGDRGLHKFLGIPYAEAPVGELRFKEPVPKKPWDHILEAEKFGNICPQHLIPFYNFTDDKDSNFNMDEDCLYLNIYVPAKHDGRLQDSLPVMFYIHSGGWSWGSSSHYDGRWLALQGDVILVTFNYRLGILGFLKTEDNKIANNGFKDQILALEWVHNNIQHFGGNPKMLTIFGHSAGGSSVTYMQTMPRLKGLFNRAISLAGVPGASWSNFTVLENRNLTQHIIDASDCSTDYLECLKTKSTQELVAISGAVTGSMHMLTAWMPSPDGNLIAESIADPYGGKEVLETMSSVDYLLGLGGAEGASVLSYLAMLKGVDTSGDELLKAQIRDFSLLGELRKDADLILDNACPDMYSVPSPHAVDLITEFAVLYPMYQTARIHQQAAKREKGTYLFVHNYLPKDMHSLFPRPDWLTKTVHGDELPLVFGYFLFEMRIDADEMDVKMSKLLITYLTNFVKSGDPNEPVPVEEIWPSFTTGDDDSLHFDAEGFSVRSLEFPGKGLQFWDKVYGLDKKKHDEL